MNPACSSSSSGHQHDDSAAAVALRGASLAFQKKPAGASPSPSLSPSPSRDGSRGNGALAAATTVGTGTRSPARAALAAQTTGGAAPEIDSPGPAHAHGHQAGLVAARLHQLGGGGGQTQHQQLHPGAGRVDPKSPSFIAATLAASRSASPGPKAPAPAHPPRRKTSLGALSTPAGGDAGAPVVVDSGSIAPTGSLISMFERAGGDAGPVEAMEHSPEEARRLAVSRFMAAPPRSHPTPSPHPPTPPPAVGRERPRAATPRRAPTPPPAISIHRAPTMPRPKPGRAESPSADATRPRPRPKSQEPAPAKTRQSSPPPVVRPPKQQKTQEPASSSAETRRPSPPPVVRLLKQQSTQEPASAGTKIRQSSPPPVVRPLKQQTTQEPASSNMETRRPSPPPIIRPPKQPAAKPPVTPLRIQPPTGPSVVRSTPEVLSPKPLRIAKPSLEATVTSPPQISPRLPPQFLTSPSPSPDPQKRSSPKAKQQPPTPPKPRGSQRLAPSQPSSHGRTRGNSDTPSSPYKASLNVTQTTSRGTPASASPSAPSRGRHTPPPPPGRRQSVSSASSSPSLGPHRRPLTNASPSNLQLDSLTDAIVAGSLASSRLTPHNSGASLPPPSLPKRQKSPRLLQTLRQPATSPDEDEDRHKTGKGHRHKLRSGKHAHHEGSRKRWREEMTPRERKRYEAVWASNRGWLLEQGSPSRSVASGLDTDMAGCVANVVVREIWRRSRLPEDELGEVWDLVDRGARGMLTRQEFVVGMWLLDQRLRGRKLPQRVSDSVWGSANGVMVKKPKAR